MSAPKTANPNKPGEISFKSKGPPKFQNKNKMKRVDQDFPEIDADKKPDFDTPVAKKDQASIGDFGGQAKPATATQQVEERKEATKPVFTSSKKKMLGGGSNVDDIINSKQNYDFSSM